MEIAGLTEEARGIYCQQKGIYQYQLDEWGEIFMKTKIDSKNNEEFAVKWLVEVRGLRNESI